MQKIIQMQLGIFLMLAVQIQLHLDTHLLFRGVNFWRLPHIKLFLALTM